MTLTDERRKAMYASKFNKARKKGFNSVNYWNKDICTDDIPEKILEMSKILRKSALDQSHITKEEQQLLNRAKYHMKKRLDVGLYGVDKKSKIGGMWGSEDDRAKRALKHHWRNERQAHYDLADLQGNNISIPE